MLIGSEAVAHTVNRTATSLLLALVDKARWHKDIV
jgi:hypothetical protein